MHLSEMTVIAAATHPLPTMDEHFPQHKNPRYNSPSSKDQGRDCSPSMYSTMARLLLCKEFILQLQEGCLMDQRKNTSEAMPGGPGNKPVGQPKIWLLLTGKRKLSSSCQCPACVKYERQTHVNGAWITARSQLTLHDNGLWAHYLRM